MLPEMQFQGNLLLMNARKPLRRQIEALCAEPGPLDGDDPRYDLRTTSQRRTLRKTQQLCAQVARTLHSVLAGESGEALLREVTVLTVEPAPHAGRLLVTLSLAESETEPAQVLERLQHAAAHLRAEVAAAIHRRRAPELAFRIALP
jgi:ribosome-binding factor A